eukprot:5080801-Prymnesium_polylepis.2
MLVLKGIAEDSRKKLLQVHPTASAAFPVYLGEFKKMAVLVFESKGDEHAAAFQRARQVCVATGATFVSKRESCTWPSQQWARQLCRRVVGEREIRLAWDLVV